MSTFFDTIYHTEEQQPTKKKIGFATSVILITIAIVFDALQWVVSLIPFVGFLLSPFVTIVAWLWFGIWFGLLGASVVRYSPAAYFGFLPLEFMPLINLIPGTFFMVLLSIRKANRSAV